MSLRRAPTRTPALLAANRANAQKSTGPRTPEGKNRVALSALRHGSNAPDFLSALAKSSRAWEEFSGLYQALYAALLPDKTDEGTDLLRRAVLRVWAMKQYWTRWAASRAERCHSCFRPCGSGSLTGHKKTTPLLVMLVNSVTKVTSPASSLTR